MQSKDIRYLISICNSCKLNLDKRWNHKFDKDVSEVCNKFCREHNINITHGSAYNELRHKMYYFKNKCIQSIIKDGIDLYDLYKYKLISDKEIVQKLLIRK